MIDTIVLTKILYVVAPVAIVIAVVVVNLAIFDSVEKFGDEVHDYFEGEEKE